MDKEKIIKYLRMICLAVLSGLSIVASDRIIDYLITVDIVILKNVLSVIIAVLCAVFLFKK